MRESTSQPDPDNPFSPPQSEDAAPAQPLPDLDGRMPSSVRLAIVCLAGVAVVAGVTTLWILVVDGQVAWLLVLLLGVLLIAVTGIARKKRQEWVNVRLFSAAFGAISVVMLALFVWLTFDELSQSLPTAGQNAGPALSRVNLDFLLFLATLAAVAACFWTAFVALGHTTARQYFDRACVACGSIKVKVVSRKPYTLRCRQCSAEW